MSTPLIAVITASTRSTRFADIITPWVIAQLEARADLEVLPIDLRDFPLPFYDNEIPPAKALREYPNDEQRRLGELFERADGYLLVTNEYNHGYSPALKNALDHYFVEFNRKALAFVGYGNVGGARAIEQLRQVGNELELATLRHAVHIVGPQFPLIRDESTRAQTLATLEPRLTQVVDDLVWWSDALATARAARLSPPA